MNRTLVFTYGRFNPPTRGHELVMRSILQLEEENRDRENMSHHIVGVSRTQDNKKNPLSPESKFYWLKIFFPKLNFHVASEDCPSFVQMLEKHSAFYNRLIFVCGEDRIDEYKAILDKYNDTLFQFDEYQFVSAGARTQSTDITGVSGTRMRQYVKDNDFNLWLDGCPLRNINYGPLWNELREALK